MDPEIRISLEFTPNPNTLKFVVNRTFIEKGAANFSTLKEASASPLAQKLFDVPGVARVMIGTDFVTITKAPDGDWDVIADEIPKTIESHLKAGMPVFEQGWTPPSKPVSTSSDQVVEKKIREVLDNEIRPAVAMDGGDVTFDRYEGGIVYLHLEGSCSSCPSAVMTLKMGVEARLKEVVPEVIEVVQV